MSMNYREGMPKEHVKKCTVNKGDTMDTPFWCNKYSANTRKIKQYRAGYEHQYKEYKQTCDFSIKDKDLQRLLYNTLISFISNNDDYQQVIRTNAYIKEYLKDLRECIISREEFTEHWVPPFERDAGHENHIKNLNAYGKEYTSWVNNLSKIIIKSNNENLERNINTERKLNPRAIKFNPVDKHTVRR